MMTLSDLRGLPHFSTSQLKTFLQCPRKYRFHYVDRVEPEFRPIALAFGTAWHETIGVMSGALAASANALVCPDGGALHVLIGHGTMMMVMGLLAAGLIGRAARI